MHITKTTAHTALRKPLLALLALLAFAPLTFAQLGNALQREALVSIGDDEDEAVLELLNAPMEGQARYYLSAGSPGLGTAVVQFHVDPFSELFIPLGETLDDVQATLQQLLELCDHPDSTITMPGCLALAFPTDETEPVTITARKVLLSRKLEFHIDREGLIRATWVRRSDLRSLVHSVKIYRKLHPKRP